MRRLAILGDMMVSGSLDMTLRVWDLVTGHSLDPAHWPHVTAVVAAHTLPQVGYQHHL